MSEQPIPKPSYEKIYALYGKLGVKPSLDNAKEWGERIANDPNFAKTEYKALSIAAKRNNQSIPDLTTFQSKFDPLKKKESTEPITDSGDGLQPPQGSGEQPLSTTPQPPINLFENLPLVPEGAPKPTTELDTQTNKKRTEIDVRNNDWLRVPSTEIMPTPPVKPEKKGMELVEGVLNKPNKKGLELVESVLDTKTDKPIERVSEIIDYSPEKEKYKEDLKAYEEELARLEEKYPVLTFPKKEIEAVERNRVRAQEMGMDIKEMFNASSQYMEEEFLSPEFKKEKELLDGLYNAEKAYLDIVKNPDAYGATDPEKKAEQIAILRDNFNKRKEEVARYRKATTIFADNKIKELQGQLLQDPDNWRIKDEIARFKALRDNFISEEAGMGVVGKEVGGGKIQSIEQFQELYMGWYSERNELLDELGLKGQWGNDFFNEMKRTYASNIGLGYDKKKVERLLELEDRLQEFAPAALVNRSPAASKPIGAGERLIKSFVDVINPARVNTQITPEETSNNVLNFIAQYSLPVGEGVAEGLEKRAEGPAAYSPEFWAQLAGTTTGIGVQFAVGSAITARGGALLLIPTIARFAKAVDVVMKSNRFGRIVYPAIKEGARYEATGQIFSANPIVSDEANFAAGFLGNTFAQGILAVPAQKTISRAYAGLFGNKAAEAVNATTKFGRTLRAAGELTGVGLGETAEEYGNEMGNIYRDSDSWAEAKELLEQRFGTFDQNLEFVISTFVMGVGMGAGSVIGKYAFKKAEVAASQLPPEQQKIVADALEYLNSDPEIEAIRNEVEAEAEEVVEETPVAEEVATEEVVDTEEVVEAEPAPAPTATGEVEVAEEIVPLTDEGDVSEVVEAQEEVVTETPIQEDVTTEEVVEEKTPEQEADEIAASVIEATPKLSPQENPALKNVESTAKALEGVDESKIPFVNSKKLYRAEGIGVEKAGEDFSFYGSESVAEEYAAMFKNIKVVSKIVNYNNPLRVDLEYNEFSDPKFERPYLQQALNEGYDAVIFRDKSTNELHYAILNDKSGTISEAYHKAKADGSNPELVAAVEEALSKSNTNESTPTKEVSTSENKIKSWIDKWEELKKENDNEQLDLFYNKVKVALNGFAQGKGVVDEFTKLKSEIEQFAKEGKVITEPTKQEVSTPPAKEDAQEAKPRIPKTPENAVPPATNIKPEEEEARAKGVKTIDGVKYTRREPLQEGSEVVFGNEGKSTFKPKEATGIPFIYGLVNMNRIETTQKGVVENHNNFVQESQPKELSETRDLENKERAEQFENELIGPSGSNPFQGFINVNRRGEVFQGTGRWNVLNYNKDKEGRIKYLKSVADQTGISPEQIDAFVAANPNAPIDIVKVYDVNDSQAIRLGNYDVKESETTPKGTAIKQAVSKITAPTATKLQTILGEAAKADKYGREAFKDKGKDILDELQKSGVLSPTEYSNMFNSEGDISTDGIDYIEDLMVEFALPTNGRALGKLPPTAKNGVVKAIPSILAVPENDRLTESLDRAIKAAYQAEKSGVKNIAQWANQKDGATGKIPKDVYAPLELAIAEILLSKSENQIAGNFRGYLDKVMGKSDLFSNTPPMNRVDASLAQFGVEWTDPASMRTDDKISIGGTEAEAKDAVKEKSSRLSRLKKKDDIRGGEFRETRPTAADNKENQQEIDNAYESTEKYTEAVTTASDNARSFGEGLKKKFDKLRGRVSGPARKRRILSPSERIRKEGFVNVIGTVVEGIQDLAELFSITRNSRIEQGTVVYLKEGKVVSFSVYSSGLIDRTAAPASYRAAEAKALGADSYYLIHNHPSGNPQPSNEDINYTQKEALRSASLGMTFKGSLVLNGGTFYQISPLGETKSHPYSARPLHEQGTVLRSTSETAEFARQIIEDTQSPITIVFFDTQGGIIDWHPVPLANTAAEMTSYIRGLHKSHGGAVNVIIGEKNLVDGILQGGVKIPYDTDLFIDPVTGETRTAERINKERSFRSSQSGSRVRELLFMDAAGNTSEDVIDNILNNDGGTFKAVINGQNTSLREIDVDVVNGFYSALEKTISNAKQEKIPAKQWIDKFATSDEAKWTGLRDWLSKQQGSLSKQQVLDYLRENRIEIVEITKGGSEDAFMDRAEKAERKFGVNISIDENQMTGEPDIQIGGEKLDDMTDEEISELEQEIRDYVMAEAPETKYSQYQLEGDKENYKEVLVTLPENKPMTQAERDEMETLARRMNNEINFPEKDELRYNELKKKSADRIDSNFKSSHWNEPNILVHLRMNTRTDADGKKVLFLEEIQSDWGQQGKKEGFKQDFVNAIKDGENKWDVGGVKILYFEKGVDGKNYRTVNKNGEQVWFSTLEDANKVANETRLDRNRLGIPTAPFVTDTNAWTKLSLKVALKEAVAQGVDKIAWATGEQQNDRYDLSKQVDVIDAKRNKDGTYEVEATKDGSKMFGRSDMSLKEIEDTFGKDIAEKINNSESRLISISGDNLKVGGKGMKGFYGSPTEGSLGIVGNVAKSLFKQEPKTIVIGTGEYTLGEANYVGGIGVYDSKGDMIAEFDTKKEANDFISNNSKQTQHSIDITPELKAQVEDGLPLMQQRTSLDNEVVEEMRGLVIDTIKAGQSISLKSMIKELIAEDLEHFVPELVQAYKDVKSTANLSVEVLNSMDTFERINSYDVESIKQEYEKEQERREREVAAEIRRAATLSELGVQSEPNYVGGVSEGGGRDTGRPDLRYAASTRLGGYGSNAVREIVVEGQYKAIDEHQRYGINMILSRFKSGKSAFLLGDGTGVGKSIQMLVSAIEMAKMTGKPSLIITQNAAIIKDNFIDKAQKQLLQLFGGAYGVQYATYSDLSAGKINAQADYGAIFLDEAHNVKNPLSKRGAAINNLKREFTVFATATPMDKPQHLEYFMPALSGMSVQDLRDYLGYEITIREDFATKELRLDASINNIAEYTQKLIELRNSIIEEGGMIRREFPFYGTIQSAIVPVSNMDEIIAAEAKLEQITQNKVKALRNIASKQRWSPEQLQDKIRQQYETRSNEASRLAEPSKLPFVLAEVMNELSAGRKVIVVVDSVQDEATLKKLDIKVQSITSQLGAKMSENRVKHGFILGSDKGAKIEAAEKFQSGELDVIIMTSKSGGTGIDLDDTTGDAPRTLIYVTPDYSGIQLQQTLGRVSRRNTKSPSKAIMVYTNTESDIRRRRNIDAKIAVLQSVQNGRVEDTIEVRQAENRDRKKTVKRSIMPQIEETESGGIAVSNAFPIKDELKALGGFYHASSKTWRFKPEMLSAVQEVIENFEADSDVTQGLEAKYDAAQKDLIDSLNSGELGVGISPEKMFKLVKLAYLGTLKGYRKFADWLADLNIGRLFPELIEAARKAWLAVKGAKNINVPKKEFRDLFDELDSQHKTIFNNVVKQFEATSNDIQDLTTLLDTLVIQVNAGLNMSSKAKKIAPVVAKYAQLLRAEAASLTDAEVIRRSNIETPATKIAKAMLDGAVNKKKKSQSRWWDKVKNIRQNLYSPYAGLSRFFEVPIRNEYNIPNERMRLERQAEMLKGYRGQALLNAEKIRYEVLGTIKINGKKSRKLSRQERQLFERYLFAMRAADRVSKGRATGNITSAVADSMLDAIRQSLPESRSFEDFEERGKIFQKVMDANLKELLKSGRIGQAQYDGIKENNDFYATFNVIQSTDYDGLGRMNGEAISTEANVISRIKGIGKTIASDYGVDEINKLVGQLNNGVIDLDQFYTRAMDALDVALEAGAISESDYALAVTALGTAGFEVTSILGAAEQILYRSVFIARKNEFMNQVATIARLDISKKFANVQTVAEGREVKDYDSGQDRAVVFYEDGIKKVVVMDRLAADTLGNLSYPEIRGVVKLFQESGKLFRFFIIAASFAFQTSNALFDFMRTFFASKAGFLAGYTTDEPLKNIAINTLMNPVDLVTAILEGISSSVFDRRDLIAGAREWLKARGIDVDSEGYLQSYEKWMNTPSFGVSAAGFEPQFAHELKSPVEQAKSVSKFAFNLLKGITGSLEVAQKLYGFKRLERLMKQENKDKTPQELAIATENAMYELRDKVGTADFANIPVGLKYASIFFPFIAARIKGIMSDTERLFTSFTLGKLGGERDVMTKRDVWQNTIQLASLVTIMTFFAVRLFDYDDEDPDADLSIIDEKVLADNIMIKTGDKVDIEISNYDKEAKEYVSYMVSTNEYITIPVRGMLGALWAGVRTGTEVIRYRDAKKLGILGRKVIQEWLPLNLTGDSYKEIEESFISGMNPLIKSKYEIDNNVNTYTHNSNVSGYRILNYNAAMAELARGEKTMDELEEDGLAPWQIGNPYRISDTEIAFSKMMWDEFEIAIPANTVNIWARNFGFDPKGLKRRTLTTPKALGEKIFTLSGKTYPLNREAIFGEE